MTDGLNAKDLFFENIHEVILLLTLSQKEQDKKTRKTLIKSAIVVSVSYWERFVEDTMLEGCRFIVDGLRNPLDLPENTKGKIALSMVNAKREVNSHEFSDSVWRFSGEGWTNQYKTFVDQVVGSFNTASSKNVRSAIWDVFGIRDVFANWTTPDPLIPMDTIMLDNFISLRHEIAHGASGKTAHIDDKFVLSSIKLLMNLVDFIEDVVWNQIANIVQKSALTLGLKSKYIFEIINYFKENGFDSVSNQTFQKISTTANSNYKKLSHGPWSLLEINSPKEIVPTYVMNEFIMGIVSLPEYIIILKNQKAFPKPNTRYLYYQDLLDYFA